MSRVHLIIGWTGGDSRTVRTKCGKTGRRDSIRSAPGSGEFDTADGARFEATHDTHDVTCKRCSI